MREKEIHDTCTCIINSLLFDRGFNIGRDRNKSRGPSIRMTLDGSLQRRSVTCRYHSMPSPYAQYVWTLNTMRGKRTTQTVLALPLPRIAARFRTRTCSFLSVFLLLSPAFPPFLYSSSSFLLSRSDVNSSSRTNFGGDAHRCDRTRRGMAAILFASATRLHCVTSSFIPDFAVDLRSEFTKTVTPVQTMRFPPFSLPDSLAHSSLFYCSPPSLRNRHCPLVVSRKHLPVCENFA